MSKALWLQAKEQLENELGREPTGAEIDERSADNLAKQMDKQYEIHRMQE